MAIIIHFIARRLISYQKFILYCSFNAIYGKIKKWKVKIIILAWEKRNIFFSCKIMKNCFYKFTYPDILSLSGNISSKLLVWKILCVRPETVLN